MTARLVAIAVAIVALIPLAGWGPAAFAAFTVAGWWAALRGRRRPAQRRRSRRVWTEQERRFILDRDRWACVECGSTDELEIDHVIPFSRGGACTVDAWLEHSFARSYDGARRAATARMLRSGARIITELHDDEEAA